MSEPVIQPELTPQPVKMVEVTSSNLKAIGFDKGTVEGTSIVIVEFLNGNVYQYLNVPHGVCQSFLAASSKGSFFAGSIRKFYPYKKVKGWVKTL